MFLSEPAPSPGELRFTLFGVPVRIHPLFWLVMILLGLRGTPDGRTLITWVVVGGLSILVHEFGHVGAFAFFGMRARIVLYAFGGLAIADQPTYGRQWTPAGTRDGWQQVAISLAGPAAGFLLAGVVVAGLFLSGTSSYFFSFKIGVGPEIDNDRLALAVNVLLYVNLAWGLLNLMPLYPLDGGHVARELLLMVDSRTGIRRSLMLSIATGVVSAVGVLLWLRVDGIIPAVMFGSLAYSSYAALRQYNAFGGGYGDDYGG
jgi:Zn-dependent protease